MDLSKIMPTMEVGPLIPYKSISLSVTITFAILLLYVIMNIILANEEKRKEKIGVIIVVWILLITSIVILSITENEEPPEPPREYGIEIVVENPSGYLNITDFWIIGKNRNVTLDGYTSEYWNSTEFFGILPEYPFVIEMICNKTPIFWGNHSIQFRVYISNEDSLFYYRNITGEYVVFESEEGYWDKPTNTFTFYYEQIKLDVHMEMIGPVCI